MADNVEIYIKALVQGLADVRALVNEIQKLPSAGAGVSNLSKEFAEVKREVAAAATEIRTIGTQAQDNFRQVATSSQGAVRGIRDTGKATIATKENLAELSQGAAAAGRAITDAFQGNILGALQSVGVALRTSLNVTPFADGAVTAFLRVGSVVTDTDKLLTRFSSTLGTAAKNTQGALNSTLIQKYGIDAKQALTEPQVALDLFVTKLRGLPDATERAAAVSEIFGASTARLLPTIEGLVAAQEAAALATEAHAAAQTSVQAAQLRTTAATAAVLSSQTALNVAQATGTASASEIAAAETALAAAYTEAAAATAAETAATEALAVAQRQLAVANTATTATTTTAAAATVTLTGALTAAAIAITAVLAAAAVIIGVGYAITKSFSDAGSVLHDMAEETGLTASELSVLKFAAEGAGSSLEKVVGSFQKYLRNINEAANGNKEAAGTFKELGINVETANESSANALEQLFVALSKIPPGAQQVNAAMKAAGKSGADLIPVINQAGGSFTKFREEAEKLGIVIDDDAAAAADNFGDTMLELKAVLEGIKNEVGSALLPTILELAKSLSGFLTDNRAAIIDLAKVIGVAVNASIAAFYLFGGIIAYLTNLVYALITALIGLITYSYNVASAVISAGKAIAQFIGGDIAGALNTMQGAVNQTRAAVQGLTEDMKRAAFIVSQPTFTSFFKQLNGGDGSTPKTFSIPKPKPTGGFTGGGGGGRKGGGGGGTSDAQALANALIAIEKARLQTQNDLLKDSIKTEQEILKERFDQNLISYNEYYDQLGETQLRQNAAQIQLTRDLIAIEERQLAKAKKGSERVKLETDILKLNTELTIQLRNQENIARRTTEEIRKQAQAYADMMADISIQLQELQGEEIEAASAKIDKQFRDQLAKAEARARETGDDRDVRRINTLKQLLKDTERFNALQVRVNELITDRDQLEDSLNNQVERGLISREAANEKLKEFENDQIARAQDLLVAMTKFADKVGSPELKAAVKDVGIALEKWGIGQSVRDVDALRTRLEAAQQTLDLRNQAIDTAVTNGVLNEKQAYEQRQIAINTYADTAAGLLSTLEAIAIATKNADLQNYVDNARADIASLKSDSDDLAISINEGFTGAFEGLFSSIAEGTKSGAQAFADFGRSILKVLSDVLVQIIVTKIAMAALGGGGQGGIGGFLSGLLGGDKAAKGFAKGGYTGGRSDDEIQGFVHGKEFVVNADATARNRALLEQMNAGLNPQRNLSAGSAVSPATAIAGGMEKNLKIVNVLPNDLLDDYVTSSDGSRALLNFIDSNVNAINAKLKQ